MRIKRRDWDGTDPAALAAELRSLAPPLAAVGDEVRAIVEQVERDGDGGVREVAARLGETPPADFRVDPDAVAGATESLDPTLLEALRTAAANIRAVAEAQIAADSERELELAAGQSVVLREIPFAAAGVYAPGGKAAYPSSALMCCIPALVAGVERVALATPPGPDGELSPVILAACAIAGVEEVYALGGAQAIAAMALGTESIAPVDVIAGPGNRYVQEAKRQLVGRVGIDGIAGPSELMAIVDGTADPRTIALDLCAQGEHGDDGLLVAAAVETALLDRIEAEVDELAKQRPSVADPPLALVAAPDADAALALADALAPEHLQIAAEDAEQMARNVRTAGCVFVGEGSGTAFGDYVAGSNHVLPTGGAGRFQGPLGPGTFRRRISIVGVPASAAAALAPPGATLARSEGFPVHGESMEARNDQDLSRKAQT